MYGQDNLGPHFDLVLLMTFAVASFSVTWVESDLCFSCPKSSAVNRTMCNYQYLHMLHTECICLICVLASAGSLEACVKSLRMYLYTYEMFLCFLPSGVRLKTFVWGISVYVCVCLCTRVRMRMYMYVWVGIHVCKCRYVHATAHTWKSEGHSWCESLTCSCSSPCEHQGSCPCCWGSSCQLLGWRMFVLCHLVLRGFWALDLRSSGLHPYWV